MPTNNRDFLDNIIVPFHLGTVDKDIISAVYDAEGKILIATNLYAKFWGYKSYKDIEGSSITELIALFGFKESLSQLEQIRQEVVQNKKVVNFINFHPLNNSIAMLLAYHYPIFNPDGEVVASRVLSEQTSVFNHSIIVLQHIKRQEERHSSISDMRVDSIQLTERQQEILYLLTLGLSQNEAASYLGITRGTLSKIVGSQICPKFYIEGSNTKILVQKVIALKYFEHIPRTLLKSKIVRIENDFEFLVD